MDEDTRPSKRRRSSILKPRIAEPLETTLLNSENNVQLQAQSNEAPAASDNRVLEDPSSRSPEKKNIEASISIADKLKLPSGIQLETIDDNVLKGYVGNLKTEHAAWKTLLAERRELKSSGTSSTALPRLSTGELSWHTAPEFLSEEEIAFLKDGPDFPRLYSNSEQLIQTVAIFKVKYNQVQHLAAQMTHLIQSRLNSIKTDIANFCENNPNVPTFDMVSSSTEIQT